MPTHEKGRANGRLDTGASRTSDIVGLHRGFPGERSRADKMLSGNITLSVWAAALILCSVLVFGLYQIRARLQAIQTALEQSEQDKKLLLEGMDELLMRTERPSLEAKAAPPPTKSPAEPRRDTADESGPNNLAKKYKIYYRAKAGEDLARISKKFGVTEDQLRVWNDLKATGGLIPGQVLVINKNTGAEKSVKTARASPPPESRRSAKAQAPAIASPPPRTVAPDHTRLAKTERAEPAAGKAPAPAGASGAGPGKAPAAGEAGTGRKTALRPSLSPGGGTVHIVQPGESLISIGRRYGVSWLAMAALNGIEPPGTIYVGQRLKIPDVPEVPGKAEAPSPAKETTYKVQQGDTLYRIGRLYGMHWERIARANGIDSPTHIHVGQVLKIPAAATAPGP